MKNIILSHYIVKDIEPEPWKETWNNLVDFGERMAPKLEPMDIKLKLRKVIRRDHPGNPMAGNMVTIQSPEIEVEEPHRRTDDAGGRVRRVRVMRSSGSGFPCRTLKDFDGNERMVLPEEFFMEATLRVAFKSQHGSGCGCADCSSCASGCGDEEQGIRH